METSLGISQAIVPLNRTTPLTSIENRTEIIEKNPLLSDDIKQGKGCHRTKVGDGRYSVSSSSSLIKNNFYAIHHSCKLNENNDPQQQQATTIILSSPSSSSASASPPFVALQSTGEVPLSSTPQQVATPPSTTTTTTTISSDVANQISRKRQTPDPTTEIIGAISPATTTATAIVESNDSKRKKLRQIVKHRKLLDSHSSTNNNTSQEHCLFKSCSSIWPASSHSLGELSHQNITELSNLLKIRLCQAKFKMMATLDQENDLFDFLNDEYVPPQPKVHHIIHLPNTHSQSTMAVIGNGKNLFRRYKSQNNNSNNNSNGSSKKLPVTAKENGNNESSGGKKQKQNSQSGKTKRSIKRKSVACDIPSVILSDGTKVYVCEPCGKKYKNRNGLTYHLERCKNKVKKEEPAKSLNCICSQPSNKHDNASLIQCEKCRSLLHTECMGLTADVSTHNDFICPHCKDDSKQQQHEDENTQITVSTIISKPSPLLLDDLHIVDDEDDEDEEENTRKEEQHNTTQNNETSNHIQISNINSNDNDNDPSSTLHAWEDFSFSSALDKMFEPWSMLSEEEPFSSQLDSADIPSQWNMNNVLNQPPSLLFSDATMSSTLEDDSIMVSSELTPLPISEHTPPTTLAIMPDPPTVINNNNNNSVNTPAQHSGDGLWFQFANFDDDYQCEQ
ncbi:hypothetical protein K501DRAFT_331674 [Backusella circina FSU 941]|nr:hypothetical protein K501DRAFT_331674 [Backusella circina FSU 941]